MTPLPPSPTSHHAAIHTPPHTVDDAHDFLQEVWTQHPDVAAEDRMALETVLSELITNVIQHNPDREVLCEVDMTITATHCLLNTTDSGNRLDPPPQANAMPPQMAESGRGLALIYLLADEVDYRWSGDRNLWSIQRLRITPVE